MSSIELGIEPRIVPKISKGDVLGIAPSLEPRIRSRKHLIERHI